MVADEDFPKRPAKATAASFVALLAWFAMADAFSSVPPFFRSAVIPVARKLGDFII
jgi:hypothetical protein